MMVNPSKKEGDDPVKKFGITVEELHELTTSDIYRELLNRRGGQEGLVKLLRSDIRGGRNDNPELEKDRKAVFGINELPPPPEVTFFEMLMEPLGDTMILLLIGSAVLSLVLGFTVPDPHTGRVDYQTCWIEGTAILLSVTIVTVVTALNNYQKEQKFKELRQSSPESFVSVTRGGKLTDILEKEILVGDLLHLFGGQVLSVDGVLLKASGMTMDESMTTGESVGIEKRVDEDCMLRSGSNVLEGEGLVLVTSVGVNSVAGRIAMDVREKKADTPLQEQLSELAESIGKLGIAASVLMFLVLSIKECYQVFALGTHPLEFKKFLDMVTTAITIVVVAVPEGLPLSVTIALAYSVKQMYTEKNLVRHLAACETMGSATTICTDKTGTLTQNVMTVTCGFIADRSFSLENTDVHRELERVLPSTMSNLSQLISESISLNSTATKKRIPGQSDTPMKYVGNKTEQALLTFVEQLGDDPLVIRARFSAAEMHSYPFSSSRKRMTTCLRLSDQKLRYHVKGASEIILDLCDSVHMGTAPKPLDPDTRYRLGVEITNMARSRLRTLAIAYGEAPTTDGSFPANDDNPPPLCLLAIIGIEDPIRPEVEKAVSHCKKAGVTVRMVTGDNKITAVAIAKKAGIYGTVYTGVARGEQGIAMEGSVFREAAQSQKKLNTILPRLQIVARASPQDKRILVNALMERGEVVAVTGDGTNDAPALKKANVGFAMYSGTDVAKRASDVIILDDNFQSIVTAMKWGRNVNDNISKFIQFQTTVNIAAVSIAFIGAVMSGTSESPLKPVQLLWLNLIMDTMAALALATETPSNAVLRRPPRGRNVPLISRRMWLNIAGQALYQILLQLWILEKGFVWFGCERDSKEHLTIVFNVFVLLQVANEFNARILDGTLNVFSGLLKAKIFMCVIVVTLLVQWFGVCFAGGFMHTVPLSEEAWIRCILLSLVPLPLGVLLRLIPVNEVVMHDFGCVRRDQHGNPITEEEDEEGDKSRMTMQKAAQNVIAQMKVISALTEKRAMSSAVTAAAASSSAAANSS